MDKLAQESKEERQTIFNEIAARKGVSPVIIEKDFWVCWMLQKIFSNIDANYPIIFKGGTSLSKVYGAIERFSEDIDLAFDRKSFGFNDKELSTIGSNEKNRRIESLTENCINYIKDEFKPKLENLCGAVLESGAWSIEIDKSDSQTLLFNYPSSLPVDTYTSLDYVSPSLRLELGSKSDHQPQTTADITPYITDYFSEYFDTPTASVVALDGQRTFWEKLTILHAEFHRPDTSRPAQRLSRHYYDAVMLHRQFIGQEAIKDFGLLAQVANFKNTFYRSGWSSYDLAKPGTLKLVPHQEMIKWLDRDYKDMQEMIFGEAPSLEEIVQELEAMEDTVNFTKPA